MKDLRYTAIHLNTGHTIYVDGSPDAVKAEIQQQSRSNLDGLDFVGILALDGIEYQFQPHSVVMLAESTPDSRDFLYRLQFHLNYQKGVVQQGIMSEMQAEANRQLQKQDRERKVAEGLHVSPPSQYQEKD